MINSPKELANDRPIDDRAVQAFLNKREGVRCQLKTLNELMNVEDHYSPADIHWGHWSDLAHVEELLEQAIVFLTSRDEEEDV